MPAACNACRQHYADGNKHRPQLELSHGGSAGSADVPEEGCRPACTACCKYIAVVADWLTNVLIVVTGNGVCLQERKSPHKLAGVVVTSLKKGKKADVKAGYCRIQDSSRPATHCSCAKTETMCDSWLCEIYKQLCQCTCSTHHKSHLLVLGSTLG